MSPIRLLQILWRRMRVVGDRVRAEFIRPESQILQRWAGNPVARRTPLQSRGLCLFAHFDPGGVIDRYVVYYLRCLRELGLDIVLISTSESLSAAEVDKALPYCIKVIHRKNYGLDFGSWRIGLLEMDQWSSYRQLILANDSVYGPLYPLGDLFKRMEERSLDFWGITGSQEFRHHLQSYFLVFNQQALGSDAFRRFWNDVRFLKEKTEIIQRYEIGLSELSEKEGWKAGAYVPSSVWEDPQRNPTLFAWDRLMEKHGSPFLKTEVLRKNRVDLPTIKDWEAIVRKCSSYDTELISANLDRLDSLQSGRSGR